MKHTVTDRTIALAAMFQATRLVQQIANTGNVDEQEMATCLQSLFRIDAPSSEAVYDDVARLETGLRTLIEQLGGNAEPSQDGQPKDLFITKYVAGVMVLERRLMKDPEMLQTISSGIERVQNQVEHFSLTHENVIAGLAHLYSQTISTMKPRIMVHGEHVYIGNATHANKIRALLLAAIRAAVLWRQCGGSRWQLFFQRRAVLDEARRLLAEHSDG
jgi:high frequency lysogenization protein